MFKKLTSITPTTWGLIAALAFIGVGIIVLSRKDSRAKIAPKALAYGALAVALSFILSCIRLYRFPQGGSVTPAAALPVIAYAFYFGSVPGLLAGAALGLVNLIQDPYIVTPVQVLLDYPIAFAMYALVGLTIIKRIKQPYALFVGIFVGLFGQFVASVISGVVFFAEYAGDMNPWLYSMAYNGTFVSCEIVICLVVAAIPQVRGAIERVFISGR